ncbi:MAG: hypothetical protein ACHQF4_11860 [Sphingobacteriales bacterium]
MPPSSPPGGGCVTRVRLWLFVTAEGDAVLGWHCGGGGGAEEGPPPGAAGGGPGSVPDMGEQTAYKNVCETATPFTAVTS